MNSSRFSVQLSNHARRGSSSSSCLRKFHSCPPVCMPRRRKLEEVVSLEDAMEELDLDYKEDDTSSLGHEMLRKQRQMLYYLRLTEHEMPKLVAFRKPFIPSTSSKPLISRSVSFAGEEHPVAVKRVIVTSVAQLPLRNTDAMHKIKILAGARWTPDPPRNAGVGPDEVNREHGYIKISCEDFPVPMMNLKWASDALDRLVAEANKTEETFNDIPVDLRHVNAKARKEKKGEHLRNRVGSRPSIRNFPQEWLPVFPSTKSNVPE